MAHQLSILFAELAEAEAELGRRVRKCRTRLATRRAPSPAALPDREKPLFDWREHEAD